MRKIGILVEEKTSWRVAAPLVRYILSTILVFELYTARVKLDAIAHSHGWATLNSKCRKYICENCYFIGWFFLSIFSVPDMKNGDIRDGICGHAERSCFYELQIQTWRSGSTDWLSGSLIERWNSRHSTDCVRFNGHKIIYTCYLIIVRNNYWICVIFIWMMIIYIHHINNRVQFFSKLITIGIFWLQ